MLEWCVDGLTDGGFHPDVVLGSHGYAPEVCSAARIARRTGAPLVVELRDALWRQWRPVYESIELARVGGTVRRADAVVHVTPQEQARDRWWLGPHPLQRVIEHGFDEAEWDEIRARARRDDGRFVIRFLGTLYPKLDLRTFLEGFERFIDELPPEQRDRVSFEYVGPSALPDDHARHALIRSVGHVPRQRALALMAETDVLVLPMGSSARSAGIPGGRFYEYLGSGRPILAAGGTVDPYVADVLSRTGAGTAVSGSEAVARELRSLLSERDAAGGGDRKAYTRRRQARELADLVSELLTRT